MREIAVLDVNPDAAAGQALDLLHGGPSTADQIISSGGYEHIPSSDVICITAGLRRKPDESRLDLINRNTDLFLSIHADSTEGSDASGATIYTLSERGSTDTAQRMADRENRSDTVNGVALADQSDSTSAILVDLSQRETQARSEQFAKLLLREARGRVHMRDMPLQSAAFVVLKSPDVASVLFETGYISNDADVARLITREGRTAFAEVAAKAIRAHFARQSQP